jgi:hypothetical protein
MLLYVIKFKQGSMEAFALEVQTVAAKILCPGLVTAE